MKLPNVERATVPPGKTTDYLLSEVHSVGRHKAAFFMRFGYRAADWQRLAFDLLQHASKNDVVAIQDSPFGRRFDIEGIIDAPDGRQARIRTVWFIEHDEETARLVTAYPLEDEHD